MDERMDGCTRWLKYAAFIDAWRDGCLDEWMDEWVDGWVDGSTRWMKYAAFVDGWTGVWVDDLKDGMDGIVNYSFWCYGKLIIDFRLISYLLCRWSWTDGSLWKGTDRCSGEHDQAGERGLHSDCPGLIPALMKAFPCPRQWVSHDLPFELRSLLMAHPSKVYISLKSFFFVLDWAGSTSE